RAATPAALRAILGEGRLGVEVFFAISGFVIAHTLRTAIVTPRYAAAFILRRSVRLDPPYWITIALALLAAHLSAVVLHRPVVRTGMPSILAHTFYLQAFLGYPQILLTFWTLCLEIQFYLLLLLLVWISGRVSRRAYGTLHVLLGLLSVATYCGLVPEVPGLFVHYWFMFVAGSTVAWAASGRIPAGAPFYVAAGCVFLGLARRTPEPVVSGVAVAILGAGVWRPAVMRSLSAKPIQWLGRISYSLYLVHPLVGEHLQNVARHMH